MAVEGVTLEQLRTLRAVAETGSFSAAARKLGRVQAAVSQAMERLEAELELRLFDRSGRSARLTPQGEAIAAAALRVAGGVSALEELAVSLGRGEERSLRLVVDSMFPTEALVAFALEFRAAQPRVELILFSEVLSSVTAHVREKRATLGVALEDADLSELDQRVLSHVTLLAVAAPGHPLAAKRGPIEADELADQVQIVLGGHRRDAERALDDQGVLSARRWRVVDLSTKAALIRGGLGWGHLPEHAVREDLSAGRLVQLSIAAFSGEALRRSLLLVHRSDVALGPVAKWAQNRLGELCRLTESHHPG